MGKNTLVAFLTLLAMFLGTPKAQAQQMTIQTDTILPTSTCPGGFMLIPFTVNNPNTNPGNRYYAEWSSIFAGFSNPDTVGSIGFIFGNRGIIPATIPNDVTLGIYQVRVVSSAPEVLGAPAPLPIIITVIPAAANISADPDREQCEGTPITLTAGLGVGGSFRWNTGDSTGSITVTTPGTYTATVTTLGCDNVSDPFVLNMLPSPAAPDVSTANSGWLTSSPGNSYQWYRNGVSLPGAVQQNYLPTSSGQYSVSIVGTNGCPSASSAPIFFAQMAGSLTGSKPEIPRDTITSWWPVELGSPGQDTTIQPEGTGLRIYPNPATDLLNISLYVAQEQKIFYHIYDARGKLMFSSDRMQVRGPFHHQVDLSVFPAGFYSLQLYANGHLQHVNILKGKD